MGNGLVLVTGGTASLMFANNKIVGGSASGTVSLGGGVSGVSLSGMVSVVFAANGSFTITGMNDMVTVFGQSLSGNFTVSDTGTGTVIVQDQRLEPVAGRRTGDGHRRNS